MKLIGGYDNGTFRADEIKELDNTWIDTICDYEILHIDEPFATPVNVVTKHNAGLHVVVDESENMAYPFDIPFYEADEEGKKEQKYPETCEDILGLIESFGATGFYNEADEKEWP